MGTGEHLLFWAWVLSVGSSHKISQFCVPFLDEGSELKLGFLMTMKGAVDDILHARTHPKKDPLALEEVTS